MKMWKRMLVLCLCLCALLPFAAACAEGDAPEDFVLEHGSREKKMVALTVDDCYYNRRERIVEDVALCNKYGVHMTFFPVVKTGCLVEKCRDIWQSVVDAGCEIGCHGYQHMHLGSFDYWTLIKRLGRWQEELDKTLGYHYQTRWLRAPGGTITGGRKLSAAKIESALKRFGYDHIVYWDVSENNPDKALALLEEGKIQNGSILLYHTNNKDTRCLEVLIPALLEHGFEVVTLSELFGFDPPEISDELYVYDRANYEDK